MDIVHTKLEAARKELLYLGLRNPLINYRPLQARGVEVVDERPTEIMRILVVEGRTMTFLPAPDKKTAPAPPTDLDQPPAEDTAAHHRDNKLQTPYTSAVLQKRLFNTDYLARAYIEEQGVNILYLALGMLHWYENESSDVMRQAPLLLVPVTLSRPHANAPFRLTYPGLDIGDNLSLHTRLAIDFALSLPQLVEEETADINAYFDSVATAVQSQPRWSVDKTAVALGFFSFNKFLMYNDLDAANWPAAAPPATHPILQALLTDTGFSPSENSDHEEAQSLDDQLPLARSHQVVDADSSQTQAILDVNQGYNLVIQGPPGTGKSQTITNLIAEALGHGKTVLFVSEKLAALEVVKRRLDAVGLGDACLELHSHKTTKRAVMTELKRTWAQGQPKENGRFADLPQLEEARHNLNAYHQAMNTAIGQSDTTPFAAYGHTLQLNAVLANTQPPELDNQAMRQWPHALFEQRLALVTELQTLLKQMGIPAQHAFWHSQCQNLGADQIEHIRLSSAAAQEALAALQTASTQLATLLHIPQPHTLTAVDQLSDTGRYLLKSPNLYAVQLRADAWHTQADDIIAALEAGRRISDLRQQYEETLIPEAWQQQVFPMRQGLMSGESRWSRLISGEYRQARKQLAGLCRTAVPDEWTDQIALVDAIMEVQRLQPRLTAQDTTLAHLFDLRWQGLATDWYKLLPVALWLTNLHKDIQAGQQPAAVLEYLAVPVDKKALEAAVVAVETSRHTYERGLNAMQQQLQLTQTITDLPFAQQRHHWQRYHTEASRFPEMIKFNRLADRLAEETVGQVAQVASTWPAASQHLTTLFTYTWYAGLLDRAFLERPILTTFSDPAQKETINRFQKLDTLFLQQNRIRLAHEHWQRLPRYEAGGQVGLLQREVNKKRQHLPIRHLIGQASQALQLIKPVFMMSPLSIAMFLPPKRIEFDLVIFDEASQVRPIDAFGAILRGKQVVVVGDSRQLPPTTFFDRVLGDAQSVAAVTADEPPSEEPDALLSPLISHQESILDLFCQQNAPQRMLRWHYRSRHESLIAVSNQAFYDQRLVIFPSPDAAKKEVGLIYHHLPQTVYERGHSRTNPQEARIVAQAIMRHAQTRPQQTLGVVTFNTNQQQAIQNQLERLRRQHPQTEPFFNAHPTEPFFVKNLENVQGDERDVILISLGYGRTAAGKLSMNFGPLNQEGGERRLNVLITRARRRCHIFTNITAKEIDLKRTQARGVIALKQYLHYARTGNLDEIAPHQTREKSALAQVVAHALQAQGHQVEWPDNVMVDLAVVDENQPGRYALGIQLDGNRVPSARDRERIQPHVLQQLGWRFCRLWSVAWGQDAAQALTWLIETMKAPPPPTTPTEPQPDDQPVIERYGAVSFQVKREIAPYQQAALSLEWREVRQTWHFDNKVGKYRSLYMYEYDVTSKRFCRRLQNQQEGTVIKKLRPALPDSSKICSYLWYSPTTGHFYHTGACKIIIDAQNRGYEAWYDPVTEQFYGDTFYSTRNKGLYGGKLFVPATGEWKHVRHTRIHAEPTPDLITAVTSEVAAEVKYETDWVVQIVAVESPVHIEEVERRLAKAAGLQRRSSVVTEVAAAAAQDGVASGRLQQRGDFLWHMPLQPPTLRHRANLPDVSRHMHYIAPEEIEQAILMVVQDAVGMKPAKIPGRVGQVFGFQRLGQTAQAQVIEVMKQLGQNGRLRKRGAYLFVAPG